MFNKIKAYAVRNPMMVTASMAALVGSCTVLTTRSPADASASTLPIKVVYEDSGLRPMMKRVDLTYLKNVKLGGVAGAYFGASHKDSDGNVMPLPAAANINFSANLQYLWERKLAIPGVTGAARKGARVILARYDNSDPQYKGIKTFVHEVDEQAQLAHNSIDFPAFCTRIKLKPFQCSTLKRITATIRGKQLVAYGMTEVMPTWDGDLNYTILDTLLRNAGENYIQSIPAMGDKLMSLGFYQFTSHAVYKGETSEGANVVSDFVADKSAQIPGSVVDLKGADHHRAAYYLMTYNMARLVRRLNEQDSQRLLSGQCSRTSLTQFIATAHHMPTRAVDKAHDWIKGKCQQSITYYMGDHLTEYATKTRNNLEALESHL